MNRIIFIYLILTCFHWQCSAQESKKIHHFKVGINITDSPDYTDIVHGIYSGMVDHFMVDSFSVHGLIKHEMVIHIDSARASILNVPIDSIYNALNGLQDLEDLDLRYVKDSAGNKIPVSAFLSVEFREISDTFEYNGKPGVQIIYIVSYNRKKKSAVESLVTDILSDVKHTTFPYFSYYITIEKYKK